MNVPVDTTPIDMITFEEGDIQTRNLPSPPPLASSPPPFSPYPPPLASSPPPFSPYPPPQLASASAVSPVEVEEEDEGINEKTNPTWDFFGYKLDLDSTIVFIAIIVIWVWIWHITGLRRTLMKDTLFTFIFISFIIYCIGNILTAGHRSGGVVYELNILLTVEQMVSILFGTFVLFTIFLYRIDMHDTCRALVKQLITYNIIILTCASLWVSIWTSGRAFRAIRKFKQGLYNVSLSFFILIGFLYLKTSCENI
jgi:hypothetical protein